MSQFRIINGNALDALRELPDESVHCCVTSPPYWHLRDYGVPGQLGLEDTPEEYISNMVQVFRSVRRVLRSDGTLWLNMGDSYQGSGLSGGTQPAIKGTLSFRGKIGSSAHVNAGLKPKDLVMMPAHLAIGLQADGWYLRSQIPWIKNNGMPESTTDRPSSMVEYIYLFAKSESYFYDREAVRISATGNAHSRGVGVNAKIKACGPNSRIHRDRDPAHQTEGRIKAKQNRSFSAAVTQVVSSRARRNSDWLTRSLSGLLSDEAGDPLAMLVNPQPFSLEMCSFCSVVYPQREYRKLEQNDKLQRVCSCGAVSWVSHFATFPPKMVEPCILSGTSERGACADCGAPWVRILEEREHVGDWHPDPENKHRHSAIGAEFDHGQGHGHAVGVNRTAKWAKQHPQSSGSRVITNVAEARAHGREHYNPFPEPITLGWKPSCSHPLFPSGKPVPCVVLDPFSGSGTTGVVARQLGRDYIGIDLKPEYVELSRYRIEEASPLFSTEAAGSA